MTLEDLQPTVIIVVVRGRRSKWILSVLDLCDERGYRPIVAAFHSVSESVYKRAEVVSLDNMGKGVDIDPDDQELLKLWQQKSSGGQLGHDEGESKESAKATTANSSSKSAKARSEALQWRLSFAASVQAVRLARSRKRRILRDPVLKSALASAEYVVAADNEAPLTVVMVAKSSSHAIPVLGVTGLVEAETRNRLNSQ